MQALEFQVTRDDYRAYLAETAPRWWDYSLRWTVGGAIAMGLAVGLFESVTTIAVDRTLFAVIVIAALVGCGQIGTRWSRRRKLAGFAEAAGPTRIEVRRDGLTIAENGARRTLPWTAIAGVGIGKSHVVLGAASPAERILIPLRAFADRADMVAFFGFCEDRIADDGTGPAEPGPSMMETDMPTQPRSVNVSLADRDWPAVREAMNSGRTILSFAQTALLTTVSGGVITGGLAAIYGRISGSGFDALAWAAAAWPGAIALTWLAARRYDAAQRALGEATWPQQREFTLGIDERGLTRSADGLMLQLGWTVITRIDLQGDAILFAMPWNEFVIAPKRCFATDAAFQSFLQDAQRWHAAARGTSAGRWDQLARG